MNDREQGTTETDARLVVVTGTSSGLGRSIASRLATDGYRVVGIARRAVDESDLGPAYRHVRADLAVLDDLAGLVRDLVAEHGTPYGLVNNAAGAVAGVLPNLTDHQVRRAVELDLLSPLLLTKHMVRPMISQGVGRVVNVSSIVAATGFRGLSVYGAAKAGVEGFTRSLARDLGPRGVTINAVAPGFLDTEMTGTMDATTVRRVKSRSPLKRFATVDEVSAAVAYLLSKDAAGVTGSVLTVDAGAIA
jgi:3-oxoacyl-[acyl-carrier protein] reductase